MASRFLSEFQVIIYSLSLLPHCYIKDLTDMENVAN